MSFAERLPNGARCASHAEAPASWLCLRCGSFLCVECERRTRPEARPMCPSCWTLRTTAVQTRAATNTRLQTAGLVLGVISLMPLWPVMIASAVVNVVGIVNGRAPPIRHARWRSIVGLIVTTISMAAWGAIFFTYAT